MLLLCGPQLTNILAKHSQSIRSILLHRHHPHLMVLLRLHAARCHALDSSQSGPPLQARAKASFLPGPPSLPVPSSASISAPVLPLPSSTFPGVLRFRRDFVLTFPENPSFPAPPFAPVLSGAEYPAATYTSTSASRCPASPCRHPEGHVWHSNRVTSTAGSLYHGKRTLPRNLLSGNSLFHEKNLLIDYSGISFRVLNLTFLSTRKLGPSP